MTHILHRSANAVMPVAVGGKGIELFDRSGASYIDASGGAAVSCLGHGHPDVLAAMHKQLDTLAYAHTGFFTTEKRNASSFSRTAWTRCSRCLMRRCWRAVTDR